MNCTKPRFLRAIWYKNKRQFGLGQAFNSGFRIWLCCLIKQSYLETHKEPVTSLIQKADADRLHPQTWLRQDSDFIQSKSELKAALVKPFLF